MKHWKSYPTLDREQELSLARAYRRGDKAAGDMLVRGSMRNVVMIVMGYRGFGARLKEELIAEGNLALVEALRTFDPDRGLRFITYAAWHVRAKILKYVAAHWGIVGIRDPGFFFRLRRERRRLWAEGCAPEELTARLAAELGCTEDRVRWVSQVEAHNLSLDAEAFRDGETTHAELLSGDSECPEAELASQEMAAIVRDRVAEELRRMHPRDQVIAQRRWLDPKTMPFEAIGKELGISRERVRQLGEVMAKKLQRRLADVA